MIEQFSCLLKEIRAGCAFVAVGPFVLKVYVSRKTEAAVVKLAAAKKTRAVRLEVYPAFYFRKEKVELYGFLAPQERSTFYLLEGIGGIGPKTALSILDSFSPEELTTVVRDQGLHQLRRIPGVGEKLARKIIFELGHAMSKNQTLVSRGGSAEDEWLDQALRSLGYSRAEMVYAKQRLSLGSGGSTVSRDREAVLKEALAMLSAQHANAGDRLKRSSRPRLKRSRNVAE